MRNILRHIFVLATLLLATSCIWEERHTGEETSKILEGDLAPDFTVDTIDGERVTLSDFRGEPMLLVLFDCGCPDCEMLLDDLLHQTAAMSSAPRILAVGRDSDEATVRAYRDEHGYPFMMAADADRKVYNHYATSFVPRAYLLDADGLVAMMTIEYQPYFVEGLLMRYESL